MYKSKRMDNFWNLQVGLASLLKSVNYAKINWTSKHQEQLENKNLKRCYLQGHQNTSNTSE